MLHRILGVTDVKGHCLIVQLDDGKKLTFIIAVIHFIITDTEGLSVEGSLFDPLFSFITHLSLRKTKIN